MGSGKSTIGRLLSNELGQEFIDSDKAIEDRAGADIPWIFDVEGEAGFRNREQAVIDQITQLSPIVLATGGGAVLRPENRHHLQSRGFVVYLQTSVDQQLERTARDRNRPLLQNDDPRGVLDKLMAERDPLYRECCDLIVKTDRRHPRSVVSEILRHLNKQRALTQPV
ncbi:Shikimate kinase I [Marinobacterium lacunae]|uniref:Shikimate kinase n=1 Tax=Marinobacterium lacunae TaxID=1232683 RepID=A0A081G2S6_9GAMM|nr:shikimate kinase AroK [Marinobacterium lacunae]KEA65081.1 Shikimate kinase I [Marinobacterium lacunae]MBR9882206.1 shikimate kinase AroK [Oceanospirillales bacterium]